MVEDEVQQQAIRRMQELRAQGLAYRPIAERMNAAGVAISHMGVKTALQAAVANRTS